MDYIKALIAELKANPLATFSGLMVAAIVYLVLMLIAVQRRMDDLQTAYRAEVVATERRCSQEIDAIRKEQYQELRAAGERQSKIEAEIRRIKKRN